MTTRTVSEESISPTNIIGNRQNKEKNNSHPRSKKRQKCRLDKATSQIVIVGCGLAGLSAALALEQAGFANVVILERDESFDTQKEGYGLTLTYNPKGPLARLQLLEAVAQQDCPSRSHYIFQVRTTTTKRYRVVFATLGVDPHSKALRRFSYLYFNIHLSLSLSFLPVSCTV